MGPTKRTLACSVGTRFAVKKRRASQTELRPHRHPRIRFSNSPGLVVRDGAVRLLIMRVRLHVSCHETHPCVTASPLSLEERPAAASRRMGHDEIAHSNFLIPPPLVGRVGH